MPWWLAAITMVLVPRATMHVVIGGIAMGEALHNVAAMAEGHHRRRRHEAKDGKAGNHDRHAEAKPGAEFCNMAQAYCLRPGAASLTDTKSPGLFGWSGVGVGISALGQSRTSSISQGEAALSLAAD